MFKFYECDTILLCTRLAVEMKLRAATVEFQIRCWKSVVLIISLILNNISIRLINCIVSKTEILFESKDARKAHDRKASWVCCLLSFLLATSEFRAAIINLFRIIKVNVQYSSQQFYSSECCCNHCIDGFNLVLDLWKRNKRRDKTRRYTGKQSFCKFHR